MVRGDIPEEVLQFVERRLDSVPHLETLLLLWEEPTRSWSEAEVGARVYVAAEQAQRILADLARASLIIEAPSMPQRYIYNSAWDETGLMEKVARAYRQHLVYIAELIHSRATSDAVRDFARAFQFKSGE